MSLNEVQMTGKDLEGGVHGLFQITIPALG